MEKRKKNKNHQRRTPNGSMKLLQLGQMGENGKIKGIHGPPKWKLEIVAIGWRMEPKKKSHK
jgi:hypothetical protein